MAAPSEGKYARVDKGGFLIEVAEESATVAGAPGDYNESGCISGTPQFTDNWDENEDSGSANWCELTETSDSYKDATLARRNGGVSYTLDTVLDSTVQQLLRTLYLGKKIAFIKVSATNVDGDVSQVLYDVKVRTPEMVPVPNDTTRMQWNVRHRFIENKPETGWPTA